MKGTTYTEPVKFLLTGVIQEYEFHTFVVI